MKHLRSGFLTAGLLLSSVLSVSPVFAAENVVQNPGFENGVGTGGGSTITNWILFGSTNGFATAFAERDGSGNENSGSFSLKLGSFGGPGFEFSFAAQEVTSGFTIGDKVTFRIAVKNPSGGLQPLSNLLTKIEFHGTSGLISQVQSSDITNSSTYVTSTPIEGVVPSGTTKVVFTIVQEMNGASFSEYFIDDAFATFQKQGPDVPGQLCSFPENASFEETGANGEQIMPGWTRFPLGSTLVNQKDNATLTHLALEGTRAVEMNIFGGQFTGIFQIIGGVLPGANLDFTVFARTDNTDFGAFGQLKIEFKDVNDKLLAEVLSEKITKDNASGEYKPFTVSGTAPEGTTFAVLVIVGDAGPGGGGDLVFDAACANFVNGPVPPIKITGDVFDSTTGQLLSKTKVQLLDGSGRVLATDGDNPFEFIVPAGASRMLRASAEGFTFPSRINPSVIQGDHGDIFNHFADTKISLPMDPGFPLKIKKDVNKKQGSRGDLLVYKISIQNLSLFAVQNVLLIDELPDVFNFRPGTAVLNGKKIPDPTFNSPMTFNLGTIAGSEELVLTYVAVVGTKAELGRQYITPAVARDAGDATQLSNRSSAGITVTGDPIFDLGTIIGKVFDDRDGDGVQDKGERGIPDVRLATEEGTVIYTDSHGRYHIPGVKPGRHIIKIDPHSLPPGSEIITEKAYLVKITEGLFAKVNFAVRLPEGSRIPEAYRDRLEVHVTQQYDKFLPRLDVAISDEEIEILSGQSIEPVYFRIEGNYLDALSGWQIHIRDDHERIVKTLGLTGVGQIPAKVEWDLQTEDGAYLEPDRIYSYELMVTDGEYEDRTERKYFRITSRASLPVSRTRPEFVRLEDNARARQTIPVANRNAVMVRGHAQPGSRVKVNGHEVYVKEDGTFEKEILLAPGLQVVKITNTDERGKTLTYVREVDVREDYFFMVGFAEGELGTRDVSKHLEDITGSDEFEDGFYEDGRIAYYLKAKIKGRYIITSSLDTERNNHLKLFTNIDPDRYYPVYGDNSTISYEGTDTKNNFYIMAEMNKSYIKWGSFETGLTDLELATFNRTMSGAKLHLEREKTTRYGDPYGGATAFYAEAEAAPDHNEFLGTGGSLYYLKNRDVIEGSEKVQVVTRDKINGRVTSRTDMIEGVDYEIEYRQGRIILTRPLSSVSGSQTIISSNILDGNQSFLVVDYEYQPSSPLENPTKGVHGYHQITENVRVGGTFVQEDRPGRDYKLFGADALWKYGRNTQLAAEYAQSREDQSSTNFSSDGGITFAEADPAGFAVVAGGAGPVNVTLDEFQHMSPERYLALEAPRRDAYSLKFQTGFWDRIKVKSYYTYINAGFSNTSVLFEEGAQKAGGEISARIAANTYFNILHDSQWLLDENPITVGLISPTVLTGRDPFTAAVIEGEESHTTTVQLTHDIGQWGLIGEYRHREVDALSTSDIFSSVSAEDLAAAGFSADPLISIFGPDIDSEDILAARATVHFSDKFIPFVEQQVSVNGEDNHQTTAGASWRVTEKIWLQGQETVGNQGNSTLAGIQAQTSEKTRIYVNQILANDNDLGRASRTTFGSATQVDEKSTFMTEKQYTSYRKGQLESSLFGYEQKLQRDWAFGSTYERIDSDGGFERDAVSGTLTYSRWNWLNLLTKLEYRQDETDVADLAIRKELRQYFTQNLVKWQATEDVQLLGRFNYGLTEDRIGDDDLAEFYEATTGFAYRPVNCDRLNFLGKYTYLSDEDPIGQSSIGLNILERSHIASIEGGYDILRWLQIVEKYAFKMGEVSVDGGDFADVKTHLWINRLNFHVTRKWDIAGEFRIRKETETNDRRTGFLVEVDREMFDHIRLGAGYNFTDFSDDLRTGADDDAEGFFVRLSGKF